MTSTTTVTDLAWARFRAALEVLIDSGPRWAGQVWDKVLDRMPPSDHEREVGLERIRVQWQWCSTMAVKAGLIQKTRDWNWQITDKGRAAVAAYSDALQLKAEVRARYRQWEATRADSGRRAWLVRPGQGGAALVAQWREQGFVSLAATHLTDALPDPGSDLATVRAAIEANYQHVEYAQRTALANEYHAFLSRMSLDDIVSTVTGDRFSIGIISGDPEYDSEAANAHLRRPVVWLAADPVPISSLPAPLPSELDQQGTVVELTSAVRVLAELVGSTADLAEPEQPAQLPTGTVAQVRAPRLPAATDQLAQDLHLDRKWLQELIELLQERWQVILHGPPGTGKTYVAQAVARHVAEREAVQLVQFHASYAYEDFFEGFRPVETTAGTQGFAKTWGPLRALANQARENPDRPYMLIVDEVNRANLSKVFGELYFLLEYRDQSVRLQYSPTEAFTLPPNLFLIGTMNTADRSIASLDAAIRRRFAFVELHPDEPPARGLLAGWLVAQGKDGDERAELLRMLNQLIGEDDRDFKIGPSYLMRSYADTPEGLERVWRHDLLPLLEEHYFGRYSRAQVHQRFGLAEIRRRLAAEPPPP
jgi:5-methylcytosine-specific restriction protein B